MASPVPPVILKASKIHTSTLIFLHGLGDTGMGWAGALNTIRPPNMKIICPTAPIIPVTLNQGFHMPAWYDIMTLDQNDAGKRECMDGVEVSFQNLDGLVEGECMFVPREKIMIGGFSQGGAIALYTTLKSHSRPLAGCIALSAYIPGSAKGDSALPFIGEGDKCRTPILQCHGEDDDMVPVSRGKLTNQILSKYAEDLEFKIFSGMGHEATPKELDVVKEFIRKCTEDK
jgi:lysophospholipase-2